MSYTLAAFKRAEAAAERLSMQHTSDDVPPLQQAIFVVNSALFGADVPGYSASEIWSSQFDIRHTNEYHIAFWLQIMAVLLFLDLVVLKLLLRRTEPLQRWYFLHFLGNYILVAYSIPSYIQFWKDPIRSVSTSERNFTFECTWTVGAVHLYHLLAFTCSQADWVHHILFVAGGVSTCYANLGPQSDIYLSHVSGFAGGLDYLNLGLVKGGIMHKHTRLRIAVELNTWVRVPGILWSYAMCTVWMRYREWTPGVIYAFVMVTVAAPVNALYYARQVTLAAGAQLGGRKKNEELPTGPITGSPPSSPSLRGAAAAQFTTQKGPMRLPPLMKLRKGKQ